MKSTTFALASLVASIAVAQPHRQHQHQHQAKHVKKDVVWVTDVVSVTETVGYTTTIWVDEGFVPSTAPASQPSSSPSAAPVAASSTPVAAQFYEPASKQSSSSVYVAPSPSSTYVAPVQSVQPEPVSEVKSSAPAAPVYVPPTTTAPAYTAPSSTAAAAAAPYSSPAAGTGSGATSGSCGSGTPCTGDFTYYDAGLGACGITNDGTTDKVVALSKDMMGAQSNSGDGQNANPYCGKTITVKYNGKTTTAKVVDKCGDCKFNSIDLSRAAFGDLADESLGRGQAEWHFN